MARRKWVHRCDTCFAPLDGKGPCACKAKAAPNESPADTIVTPLPKESVERLAAVAVAAELASIARLSRELKSATERANDLAHTNERLSRSRLISPEEESTFREVMRTRDELNNEINTIARYFRDHFTREITDGKHAGKSLSEIVCFYLSEYRRLKRESGEA